jgi:methylmalonyl-CoA/ethylmalonyl-CoA epimerase
MSKSIVLSGLHESELEIHHVGYAVNSIEKTLQGFYVPCLSPTSVSEIFTDPVQKVRVVFVEMNGGRLELIEPLGAESPVARILASKRGGLYHVGYSASRFDEAVESFKRNGCRLVSGPSSAVAFKGQRVSFLITPNFDIVELIESPRL